MRSKKFNQYDKRRETMSNPFRRKRAPNQKNRYLNKREQEMPRTMFDRAGNRNV